MLQIKDNFNLKVHNTFCISAYAEYFVEIKSEHNIIELFNNDIFNNNKFFVLGGGSNVLFKEDFKGLIIYINNKGIKLIEEDDKHAYIEIAAGEDWEDVIDYCEKHNYQGIENLSYIPGKAGSAPVQNIGAYGVEIKDVIHKVNAFHIDSKSKNTYSNTECKFRYRDSIFKTVLKNKTIIYSIVLKLNKFHQYNTSYKALAEELTNYKEINLSNIRNALYKIRNSKLPDYKTTGNAGSFFKNPIISEEQYSNLKLKYDDINAHKTNEGYKISAAWLIENAGWKNKESKTVSVYDKHALVIINKGNASGRDIIEFANLIINDIFKKFQIKLQPEVNFI